MDLNDVRQSKYLKKEDVGTGILVTIAGVDKQNVAKEGAEQDEKVCLHFMEVEKPLVLNTTNAQIIAKFTGIEKDIENKWVGVKVVLFTDPNISFNGKLVGGIRVRQPKAKAQAAPAPVESDL